MLTSNYLQLRQELAEELRGLTGVISVGIGRGQTGPLLTVLVDPLQFAGGVPDSYKGVGVAIRQTGQANFYIIARS